MAQEINFYDACKDWLCRLGFKVYGTFKSKDEYQFIKDDIIVICKTQMGTNIKFCKIKTNVTYLGNTIFIESSVLNFKSGKFNKNFEAIKESKKLLENAVESTN